MNINTAFQGKVIKPWHDLNRWLAKPVQCARLAFGLVGVYDHDEAQRILSMTPGPEGNNAQKAPRTGGAKRNKTPMGVDALREHLGARQA
jgi:hypothetical protein